MAFSDRGVLLARRALFAALLISSAYVREGSGLSVAQAVIWFPSGVAVAGLWLLGAKEWWVVAACVAGQRLLVGNGAWYSAAAGAGSAAEALVGAVLLRSLGFDAALARLRDILALVAAASAAPAASIAAAWLGRGYLWVDPGVTLQAGWDGWWRMNALGILAVVPPAAIWLSATAEPVERRWALRAGLIAAGTALGILVLMRLLPVSVTGVLMLVAVLPISLYAGVRFGPRGAASAGALAAIVVALGTGHGLGPFQAIDRSERHSAVQVFELLLITMPLALGVLVAEREAAREKGAQSEALRRSTQLALPDLTYRIRRDLYCSDLFLPDGMQAPLPRERIVGWSLHELLPPETAVLAERTVARVLADGSAVTIDFPLVVDGRRRTCEARCVPYGADEILAVVRDVTERTTVEKTTAFEARILNLVAAGRPAAEVFGGIVAGMEELTEGLCSIRLLEAGRMRVATAPSLPPAFVAGLDGIDAGPEAGSCGAAVHRARTVVVEDLATDPLWTDCRHLALPHGLRACWSTPIRESTGSVIGTFTVYYRERRTPDAGDLAFAERAAALAGIAVERERRIEALRRSEDLLASINRNVNEGLYRRKAGGGLVYVNPAFARMFGYDSPGAALADPDAMRCADPQCREALSGALAGQGRVVNEEVRFLRRDGSVFWGLVSISGIRDEKGNLGHEDGVIADVTARKALEEQFRQSQKMEAVGKLAGGVAHDFNNLLTVVLGYAEEIGASYSPAHPTHAHAREIESAARRGASLTRQLLAYSRQQLLNPQVLDLIDVVDELGEMLRRLIGEDIRLVTRHASGRLRVRVDRSQLEQVIVNLAVNARDAMPHGGELCVETSALHVGEAEVGAHADLHGGAYAVLAVRDTGVGMSPEVLGRAFDPFFTTKEPGKGSGLGLSTVFGIVKQSGGATWLESVPGGGTVVRVHLPRSEEPGSGVEPVAAADASGPFDGTILLAEDEPAVRMLAREALVRAGYGVLEAEDGEEALAVSRRHGGTVDLLLTDVVMPNLGGRELAARLLLERPGVRVLFMSGYPNDARELGELAGSTGELLQKPFALKELVERVRAQLPGR